MNPRGISLSADFTHHIFFPVPGDGLGGTGDEEAHEVRVHQLCLPHSV
jgi:hypothetical protein